MSLGGHTALVTGAGRNLGRAIALELARQGADVAVNTRTNKDEAEGVCREIEALGRRAHGVQADVSDQEQVRRMVESVAQTLGPVDVLVSNAVARDHTDFLSLTEKEWRGTLGVVLDGAYYLTQQLLPAMLERGWGRVIYISAYGPFNQRVVPLAAGKFALHGLCQSLARGYGDKGILFNTISPGVFDTAREQPLPAEMLRAIPLGKLGQPADVARLCAFLASDENAFITGQNIYINGGEYMKA